MIDSSLHTYSLGGTLLIAVAAGVGIYFTNEASGGVAGAVDPYANMVVIDAALAQKGPEQEKQPQKEFRAPTPPEKPVGVSHDENAKPVTAPEPPTSDRPDQVDVKAILAKNRSNDDDDLPVGKPKIELGKIDGVEIGFGDKTYGNPYLGALKSGVMRAWEYPEILSDVGTPVGCIQLNLDGTIDKIEVKVPSGNAELDDSVERALTEFQKKNNKEPKPLPTTPDDLSYLARMELCWRMKV